MPQPLSWLSMPERLLDELQSTIEREIPMCAHMGIHVHSYSERALTLRAPLERNFNHQRTAFAGSLNALCTMAGWANVFMLTRRNGLAGDIVIRRSTIKYLCPVDAPEIIASCAAVADADRDYFLEMLEQKGQAKLDLRVEILAEKQVAVSFSGSYVVLDGA